mmetsp:Transcript_17245/g.37392  ORF Transcript_17245/g.37392 Transcript_17245/m.37392 type:complete len:83 (-) Transcript_17245:712-960(-)
MQWRSEDPGSRNLQVLEEMIICAPGDTALVPFFGLPSSLGCVSYAFVALTTWTTSLPRNSNLTPHLWFTLSTTPPSPRDGYV